MIARAHQTGVEIAARGCHHPSFLPLYVCTCVSARLFTITIISRCLPALGLVWFINLTKWCVCSRHSTCSSLATHLPYTSRHAGASASVCVIDDPSDTPGLCATSRGWFFVWPRDHRLLAFRCSRFSARVVVRSGGLGVVVVGWFSPLVVMDRF